MLEVQDGEVVVRQPAGTFRCAAVVDLADDGRERGLWLGGDGPRASIMRLTKDGRLELLFSYASTISHGLAGSEHTSVALQDLDGDGTFELTTRTTRHDDTGGHAEPTLIYARGKDGGAFVAKKGSKPTPANALYLGDKDPLGKAIAATMKSPLHLLAIDSLSLVQRAGDCGAGLAQASPPVTGSLFALVSYPAGAEKTAALPLTLHIVRAFTSPPIVLASAPIGTLSETFTSDACRLRVRVGTPLIATHAIPNAREDRAIVAIHASGTARIARAFRWDGRTLVAGAPLELDRCDSDARTIEVLADAALRVIPAPTPPKR
ncbi:MAG: hypothetical protein IT381_24985 [Deltaproteobacteria bacterium]|nr:hypothetical protein [Deltaproteobacteria bacterium]